MLLGTSPAADSFILAFRIPNLLRRLVGEGSLTAAFIPVFAGYLKEKPREEVWEFANRLFWTLAALLVLIAALGTAFSPAVIRIFTLLGGNAAHWGLAVYLNRIIFPYVFFIGLAALATAILNSFHEFGLPASTPILFNISIIAFSFGTVYGPIMKFAPVSYRSPAVALSVGVLAGGLLQLGVQLPALWRKGMRFRPEISLRDPGIRQVFRLMLPGFVGIGVFQINFFVDTVFATSARMPQGSVTSLYVADRVMELALGSFAIAVSTAILPLMSHQAAAGDFDAHKRTLTFALRLVSFLTLPAAAGLVVLRTPIVQVLFEHGQFIRESAVMTSRALLFYALGLPGFAAVKLIVPAFYSRRDTRTPVMVAACAMLLNVMLNIIFLFLFFRVLRNGSPALATSVSSYFNFFLLFVIFRKRFGRLGARGVAKSLGKIAASAGAMGLFCVAMLRIWNGLTLRHSLTAAIWLAAMIGTAAGVYWLFARIFNCEEIGEVMEVWRERRQIGSDEVGAPLGLE